MWDDFCHTHPELIKDKSNGDVACDSYHKYEEDIALLKDLRAEFYRMSISWPRIFNDSSQVVNQDGIDYYTKVLKLLKENNIEPLVTLYHWDLPLWLHELGGWTNPQIVPYFGDYARTCFSLFGEYVKYWITINEPQSTCFLGYGAQRGGSMLAPDYDLEAEGVYLCAYTTVKAHALAYRIYESEFKTEQKGKISIAQVSHWYEPASDSSDDLLAQELALQFNIGLMANPIFLGNWPQLVIDRVGNRSQLEGLEKSRLPEFSLEEIDYIKGTYDYYAINYYVTLLVESRYKEDDLPGNASYYIDRGYHDYSDPSWPHSNASTWLTVVPWGFRKILNWIHITYNQPEIIVTENGWADDGTTLDDPERIDYIEKHLTVILNSINEDGTKIKAYNHWSLLDNFEWISGYTSKFGVISVNFTDANRTRTPKRSYHRFREIISSKCLADKCTTPGGGGSSSMILPTSFTFLLSAFVLSCVLSKITI